MARLIKLSKNVNMLTDLGLENIEGNPLNWMLPTLGRSFEFVTDHVYVATSLVQKVTFEMDNIITFETENSDYRLELGPLKREQIEAIKANIELWNLVK